MADLDEEAIMQPSSASQDHSANVDHDISDETQDFRFLSAFDAFSDTTQPQTLPRRGEKDFEPNPTVHQADVLASSRNAMHSALSYPRLHNLKNRILAIYCPSGFLVPPQAADSPTDTDKTDTGNTTTNASGKTATDRKYGVGGETCVCVPNPRGQHFRTMGRADSWNRVWLLPEEALYLLERGSLDIRWPAVYGEDQEEGAESFDISNLEDAVPMSLQAGYACFMGRGGLSLERYSVFTGLKRGGYVVIRADGFSGSTEDKGRTEIGKIQHPSNPQSRSQPRPFGVIGALSRFFSSIFTAQSTCSPAHGPLIGLGIHRSYADIYRALSIIPAHDPSIIPGSEPPATTPPYQITFHVYKPSTPFRISNPGQPDFRLAVISARDHPTIPTLSELSALLESTPLEPPRGGKLDRLLYMRLRHGWRNVILGVVDQGVVSYLRISDVGFIKEPLYAQKSMGPSPGKGGGRRPGGKRGGKR